ncbi:hypothetical protein [Paenibacillus etheri]|uniref:Radical SAM core domain-containing protein n=1 Tax=Paenibacillus etheri TaxID=1306852 RepID=A0A0W1AVP6_9BACL|nr:hypothetical protein [Paenibacillus etheri]KTD85433.1 hypothetical protein UQ64_18135 [Paenibacillus etheri]
MVQRLKACQITFCQITLDGPPDIHDNRRFLIDRSGKKAGPTFHKILENIKDIHEDIHVNIRVNVDKTNINRVDEILDLLEQHGLKNKVGFYLAPVDDSASSCVNLDCFSSYEFSGEELQVYRCPYVVKQKQEPRCDSIRYNAKHLMQLLHEVKSAELSII